MGDWSAAQYLKFKSQRTQPAKDLAARVRTSYNPKTAVDIGCGPGNSTAVLHEYFPNTDILGIDSSPNMIETAKTAHPELQFALGDAANLTGHYDLLFSNACLQWIPNHRELIPALLSHCNEGGTLAVQVPANYDEPLFRLIDKMIDDPKWELRGRNLRTIGTLTPAEYIEVLGECAASFDFWETKYYHILENHKAMVEWVKGTKLRPYLEALGEEKGKAFEEELLNRAIPLYPTLPNGNVVFGFRRLFFTAIK